MSQTLVAIDVLPGVYDIRSDRGGDVRIVVLDVRTTVDAATASLVARVRSWAPEDALDAFVDMLPDVAVVFRHESGGALGIRWSLPLEAWQRRAPKWVRESHHPRRERRVDA